jgi:hypothetical protein
MPSYGVFGWQRPCYLLQEGFASSYAALLESTRWERYGHASGNPACRDCMVHSGFEASAVAEGFASWRGFAAMARAFCFGPRSPAEAPAARREVPRVETPAELSGEAAVRPQRPAVSRGDTLDASPESLAAAFRYRGDVALELADGSRLEGFVANLGDAHLELWLRRSTDVRRIPRAAVRRVAFTGRDRAAPPPDRSGASPPA